MRAGLVPDAWPALPLALAAALAGQGLLLSRFALAGVLAYLAAGILLLAGLGSEEREATPAPADVSGRLSVLALSGILFAAFLLRRLRIDAIPWGLNNDEGIEGLIACRFLSGDPITPFSSIGVSRETLYHVLLLPLFRLLGPGISPLRFLSLLAGLAAVALIYCTGRQFFSARTGLLAAALLACSPWHILYSRTGLRNILVPGFVLASLWLFHLALERSRLLCFGLTGVVLGIGMYSYTSFRVIPALLVLWALLRRWILRRPALSWRAVLATSTPFVVLMLPQIVYAARDPVGFLTRGNYVLAQTPDASLPGNLLYSLLMPVVYPARFGVVQSLYYFGDGVSLVYAAVARTPETAVSAALMACGFVLAGVRVLRRRSEGEGILLLGILLTTATVGIAGPSLTRLIGNLPLLCLIGARFLEEVHRVLGGRFHPRLARAAVGILLTGAGALGYDQYFNRVGTSEKAMFYYAYPQTLIGLYAASRASEHPVFVFYTQQREALQFLTYARRQWVVLSEDPESLDLEKIRSARGRIEFVMENHRRFLGLFTALARIFPGAGSTYLSDARHFPDRRVAYVLDVVPDFPKPPAEAPPFGEPPPSP